MIKKITVITTVVYLSLFCLSVKAEEVYKPIKSMGMGSSSSVIPMLGLDIPLTIDSDDLRDNWCADSSCMLEVTEIDLKDSKDSLLVCDSDCWDKLTKNNNTQEIDRNKMVETNITLNDDWCVHGNCMPGVAESARTSSGESFLLSCERRLDGSLSCREVQQSGSLESTITFDCSTSMITNTPAFGAYENRPSAIMNTPAFGAYENRPSAIMNTPAFGAYENRPSAIMNTPANIYENEPSTIVSIGGSSAYENVPLIVPDLSSSSSSPLKYEEDESLCIIFNCE